uniref:Uncharacterized protein n=1 Tax=Magallana gigas TaxID=29159 RepID=K1RH98_MAGGI
MAQGIRRGTRVTGFSSDNTPVTVSYTIAVKSWPRDHRDYNTATDDGWAMGQKKGDGTKGVFPLNFTKKL